MITIIIVAITSLFFVTVGTGIAMYLVRRELYRIICETRTFLMDRIFEERTTIEAEIQTIKTTCADDSMAELIAEYKKLISAATKQVQKEHIPQPPVE